MWSYIGVVLLLVLNWFCYTGILEAAASPKTSTDLAGGAWLDVVALVWLVQAGTALWSYKAYYLLSVMPLWGVFKAYTAFKSALPSTSTSTGNVSEESKDKGRNRAERRQRKKI